MIIAGQAIANAATENTRQATFSAVVGKTKFHLHSLDVSNLK